MKNYKITDKATKSIIGVVAMTPAQARRKAVEALEYNPMCYNCKNFGKSCKGSTNKIYSGCVYKEVDKSKKSIYAQILEQVK